MDFAGQLLPGADVRVLGLLEQALQSLQLLVGEDGAVPPLPAAVQLVEELQLGPRQAAHVHVGHHLVRDRRDQHRARAVVACTVRAEKTWSHTHAHTQCPDGPGKSGGSQLVRKEE